jgi:hypothetical protein
MTSQRRTAVPSSPAIRNKLSFHPRNPVLIFLYLIFEWSCITKKPSQLHCSLLGEAQTQYVLCESPRNRSNTESNVVTAPAIYLCSSCNERPPSFHSSTSTRPSPAIWFTSLYMSQTLPYTVSLTF